MSPDVQGGRDPGGQAGDQSKTIRLADGWLLGFIEWGDPRGTPVLEIRGLPSSSRAMRSTRGSCLPAGSGGSPPTVPGWHVGFLPGRSLLDWPDDAAELAGALGMGDFTVLGTSDGGPYALACSYQLPARVRRVAVSCGRVPLPGLGRLSEPGRVRRRGRGPRGVSGWPVGRRRKGEVRAGAWWQSPRRRLCGRR